MHHFYFAARQTFAAVLIVLAASSCKPEDDSNKNGGGIIKPQTGSKQNAPAHLISVEGYVLAPQDKVPDTAIGYAVPVFTNMNDAARFCPLFLNQLTFAGQIKANTNLKVDSYGHTTDIAPFVWPVTSWSKQDKASCDLLSQRYSIAGARMFFNLAQQAIAANGGKPADALQTGPFIVTARRVSKTVMVFDLTRAPHGDYNRWLAQAVQELSNPLIGNSTIVTPTFHDQVRAFVFSNIPVFDGVLQILVPGYREAQSKG